MRLSLLIPNLSYYTVTHTIKHFFSDRIITMSVFLQCLLSVTVLAWRGGVWWEGHRGCDMHTCKLMREISIDELPRWHL